MTTNPDHLSLSPPTTKEGGFLIDFTKKLICKQETEWIYL
jgi:hypothetical protein